MTKTLRWQIALTMVQGVGPVMAKSLLTHFDIEEIFLADRAALTDCGLLAEKTLKALLAFADWKRVEEEVRFIERNQILPLFITDAAYPKRLLSCPDAPTLLYYKGKADLNASKTIAVVGTRDCTRHGVRHTEELIEQLVPYSVTIISGLAMGIDTAAHQSAIKNGLPTVAVLPLGLDTVYPGTNRSLAKEILRSSGGLLTESMTRHCGDTYLFPRRNRIVAGLCDATLIVESGTKGGSLVTARLACDYGRDVFAMPGRPSDSKSSGCHQLIKQNKALLAATGDDIADWMGWKKHSAGPATHTQPLQTKAVHQVLDPNEVLLLEVIRQTETLTADQLQQKTDLSSPSMATALINLELAGLIVSLPGNRYQAV